MLSLMMRGGIMKININFFLVIIFFTLGNFVYAQGSEITQPVMRTNLGQISRLCLENSFDVQIAQYEVDINRTDLKASRSIYDTNLNLDAGYLNNQHKSVYSLSGTKSTANNYSFGLSKKIFSGTNIAVDFIGQRNSTDSTSVSITPAYEAEAKISLRQPVGKNYFGLIDRGRIKITKLQIENSDYTALNKIEQALAKAQIAYWNLVLKYEEHLIETNMLKKAESLYALFKKKKELGLIEDAELFAAHANVAKRQSNLLGTEHNLVAANNSLLMCLHLENLEISLSPEEKLDVMRFEPVGTVIALEIAFANRRDYQQARKEVEIKKINLKLKENSLWPEIDLQTSFSHNGVNASQSKAWQDITAQDNPEFYAGINLHFPLENTLARSNRDRARLEKGKAIISLQKVELLIQIGIDTCVDSVNNILQKIKLEREIVGLQKSKLAFEEKRFNAGRSTTDTLIRYQEDLLNAKLSLVRNLFFYKQAEIDLKLAQNSLLAEYSGDEL